MSTLGMTMGVARSVDIGDCTNNGITARFTRLTLVGIFDERGGFGSAADIQPMPRDSQLVAATADQPAVLLHVRQIGEVTLSLMPAVWDEAAQQWVPDKPRTGYYCFGGNYASITDSRFGDLCQRLTGRRWYGALAVHDRMETYR